MSEKKPERAADGRFLEGHGVRGGRMARQREDKYRQIILSKCSPEKFGEILDQATTDALDGKSWKCRNAARNWLIHALERTGVIGEVINRQTNVAIFSSGEQIQAAIAERLQELMVEQQPEVIEVEAEGVGDV